MRIFRRDQPQARGQIRRDGHAATHRFAVQPFAVAQARFNRVGEGVAKIQDGAQAGFAFVLRHHPGFDFARTTYGVRQCRRVAGEQRIKIDFQPGKEGVVGNRAVFDDLCQARDQLPLRQRAERCNVSHHQQRLIEHADHVFPHRVVDGGFAAHRRVHLGQQGGGHLHIRHAAHVAGCGEARHVTHHAATQGEECGFAVAGRRQQRIKNSDQCLPIFVCFPVGQHHLDHLGVTRAQSSGQALRVQWSHGFIADDGCAACGRQASVNAGVAKNIGTNDDVVAAFIERNAHALEVVVHSAHDFKL